jgi:hypothetical protein
LWPFVGSLRPLHQLSELSEGQEQALCREDRMSVWFSMIHTGKPRAY